MTSTELATYYKSVVDLTDASKSYKDAKPEHPKICPFMSRPVIYESPCVYAAPAVGQYESTSTLQYTFHKQPCLQEECMAWVPLKRDKEKNIIQYPRCRLIP